MYFSPSVSKRLVLVPTLVVVATQMLLMGTVSSLNMTNSYLHHKCLVSQGKYKPGSKDEKDFNTIIKSLSKDTYGFRTGYSMMAYGDKPDMVSVTFQCRGDSYGQKCGSCFATAQSELRKRCPRDKGGIIWYDQCLVEFSSIDTVGQINYDDSFCMASAKNFSGNPMPFEMKLLDLIGSLMKTAITKRNKIIKDFDKPVLYAAGEMKLEIKKLGAKKLYGMVQCMLDLTDKACEECISYNIVHFQDCYKNKLGGRVLGRSCSYRFELYPFVDTKNSPN